MKQFKGKIQTRPPVLCVFCRPEEVSAIMNLRKMFNIYTFKNTSLIN